MNKIKENVGILAALLALLGTTTGGYVYMYDTFALASDVKKLELRLDMSELRHLYKAALDDFYFHKAQLRKYPDDQELADKVKEAKDVVDSLKDQMKGLSNAAKKMDGKVNAESHP